MATLDDLPRMLDEDPVVRDDLISILVDFCARHGIEVTPDELVGRNITDDQVNGYIVSHKPAQALPEFDDLPGMLSEDPVVREDLISSLVDFCTRRGIEVAPDELVGLTGDGGEVTGYGGGPVFHLGSLQPLFLSLPVQPTLPAGSITIQIQIL